MLGTSSKTAKSPSKHHSKVDAQSEHYMTERQLTPARKKSGEHKAAPGCKQHELQLVEGREEPVAERANRIDTTHVRILVWRRGWTHKRRK